MRSVSFDGEPNVCSAFQEAVAPVRPTNLIGVTSDRPPRRR